MTKGYEKLLAGCQTYVFTFAIYPFLITVFSLSELLYLPMPTLPTNTQKNESVLLLSTGTTHPDSEEVYPTGGKWEDEEERRFYEDLQDLKDFVPKSVLGLDASDKDGKGEKVETKEKEKERREEEEQAEIQKLEKEIEGLGLNGVEKPINGHVDAEEDEDEYVLTMVHIERRLNAFLAFQHQRSQDLGHQHHPEHPPSQLQVLHNSLQHFSRISQTRRIEA